MSARVMLLLASLSILASGCGTPLPTAEIDTRLASAPTITYSKADTCLTQQQIEAYHSWRDTQLKGTEIVYRPACNVTKPAASTRPEPKPTS